MQNLLIQRYRCRSVECPQCRMSPRTLYPSANCPPRQCALVLIVLTSAECLPILHTGRGHWVTISTISCENSEVQVFDSMPPAVTSSIKKQIAALVRNKEKNIILRYNNVENI